MKKLLSLLLLATVTATAYADKNAKASKVKLTGTRLKREPKGLAFATPLPPVPVLDSFRYFYGTGTDS